MDNEGDLSIKSIKFHWVIIIIIIWGITLLGAFKIGKNSSSGDTINLQKKIDSTTASSTNNIVEVEREILISALTPKDQNERTTQIEKSNFDSRIKQAIGKTLSEGHTRDIPHDLSLLFSAISLKNIRQAIDYVNSIPIGPQRESIIKALLDRWGEQDGLSALSYALESTSYWEREVNIKAAISGWARSEPEEAYKWAKSNPTNSLFNNSRLNSVLKEIAQKNPEDAFKLASEVSDESHKSEALKTVVDELVTRGLLGEAINWSLALADGMPRTLSLAYAVQKWARYEPEAAGNWVSENFDDPATGELSDTVARMWSASDPNNAMSWAVNLPEGNIRKESLHTIVERWIKDSGYLPAAEYLNQFEPHADFDTTTREIVVRAMNDDPESAMSWVDSIVDENLQKVLRNMVEERIVDKENDNDTQKLLN